MYSCCTYVPSEGNEIFTMVFLPEKEGRYPAILLRNPYVKTEEDLTPEEVLERHVAEMKRFTDRGYAAIYQHCRGCGQSKGEFLPFVCERADGLALQEWVRRQSFYNGEQYLLGGSYLAYVHYATFPFAPDVKAAVLSIMDPAQYGNWYLNGSLKIGLLGDWFGQMYRQKTLRTRAYTRDYFNTLPLDGLSELAFGEPSAVLDGVIRSPEPTDPHWSTPEGSAHMRDAMQKMKIPVLYCTGQYDIFVGGMRKGWRETPKEQRDRCALLISAYDHGDAPIKNGGLVHEKGSRAEQFGRDYEIDWFDAVRGLRPYPVPRGQVTYYRLFEDRWETGDCAPAEGRMALPLGSGARTYTYNPFAPTKFPGGLTNGFGGSLPQPAAGSKADVVSVYTEPFARDVFVRGAMEVELTVASDCEDTGFYVRVDIEKPEGDYGLRDSITSLCRQAPDYVPGRKAKIRFSFDEHAFLIRKGERLRIDIASADNTHYVRHTNRKGPYWQQREAKAAHNTVWLDESALVLPTEE